VDPDKRITTSYVTAQPTDITMREPVGTELILYKRSLLRTTPKVQGEVTL